MPYFIAVVPALAFVSVVGAAVSLIRGRPHSAVAFGVVGLGAILYATVGYYADGAN
jgi:hypothetical protein